MHNSTTHKLYLVINTIFSTLFTGDVFIRKFSILRKCMTIDQQMKA